MANSETDNECVRLITMDSNHVVKQISYAFFVTLPYRNISFNLFLCRIYLSLLFITDQNRLLNSAGPNLIRFKVFGLKSFNDKKVIA